MCKTVRERDGRGVECVSLTRGDTIIAYRGLRSHSIKVSMARFSYRRLLLGVVLGSVLVSASVVNVFAEESNEEGSGSAVPDTKEEEGESAYEKIELMSIEAALVRWDHHSLTSPLPKL